MPKTCRSSKHYKNVPMYRKFSVEKIDILLIFAQNIDCGYLLEPPHRGGSNEYPQSMFWSKNKKNRYTPAYTRFAIKVGYKGVYIISSPEPSGSQGELIVYPCSVVRPSVVRPSVVHHFQRSSSLKQLGQSKPNFT